MGPTLVPAKLRFTSPDTSAIILDGGTPQISTISLPSNGSYDTGSQLSFTFNFNRAVDVGGTPRVGIKIGNTTRFANYYSGSGSSNLTFRYIVQVSDGDLDGIELISPVQTNGGSVRSTTGAHAVLTFTSPATPNILVNAVAPTITSLSVPSNNTYKMGDALSFLVTFRDNVNVSGAPRLPLYIGGSVQHAQYISGSGTSALIFRYIVQSGYWDADGINILSPLDLNSGSITSDYGANANLSFSPPNTSLVLIDGILPEITSAVATGNQSYDTGSSIEFSLTFNRSMLVTGTPRIPLTVGATTRYASYVSGSGSSILVFRYTVVSADADLDGIQMDSSISLNGGAIQSHVGNNASLGFNPPATSGILVNATSPVINSISSTPGTYKSGDVVAFQVAFDRPVVVSGTPQMNLSIGGQTKIAQYASGSGTSSLTFQYTVTSMDAALNGISVNSPLSLNSGTIISPYGSTALLTFSSPDTSSVVVDGLSPSIVSIIPPINGNYETSDTLEIAFTFNRTMLVTGSPRVQMAVGSSTRYANYISGSGSETLVFRYTVLSNDADLNGIELGSTLILNGGSIKSSAGNNAILAFLAPVTSSVLVNATQPTISSIGLPSNGTYKIGDFLNFSVTFDRAVTVMGSPRLTLDVGGTEKAILYQGGSGSATLTFSYAITTGDVDLDGVAMSSPLNLNGGTIKSSFGANAVLTFTAPNTSAVLVDGLVPSISSVTLPGNAIYETADSVNFTFNYDRTMVVTGVPRVQLTVGSTARYATYVSGSGTSSLTFRYSVGAGDSDTDGIALSTTIDLNSGTIKSSAGNASDLTFPSQNTAGILINAKEPLITSVIPPTNGTYKNNDVLNFSVTFDRAVTVVGSPRIQLDIGGTTKYAAYLSGSASSTLVFRLIVDSTSSDTNGIELISPIELNGGTIKSSFGVSAVLTYVTPDTTGVLVDGVAPEIQNITLPVSKTYKKDDVLNFAFDYNREITVTGSPRLAIKVGSSTRYAYISSGSGTTTLTFSYTIIASDVDSDGIDLVSPLQINSGTMRSAAGNNAVPVYSLPNSSGILVDGVVPTISSVVPPANKTYIVNDILDLTLTYNKAVTVDATGGTPQIALGVGASSKYATYVSGSGSNSLVFRYTVAAGDSDSTGVTYANTITLNGGTIKSAAGNNASLNYSSPNTSAVIVDGVVPWITNFVLPSNKTYKNGDTLSFSAVFNKAVTVTGGTPRVSLDVGGTTRYATLASGSGSTTLVFNYIVVSSDVDTDGIDLTTSLDLNGSTIKSNAGNTAILTFSQPNSSGILVDGVIPSIATVTPPTNNTYNSGQVLSLALTFTKAVTVSTAGGTPRVTITIGTSTYYIPYSSGSGTTTLNFSYTVQPGDVDPDGIVYGSSIDLNGGTIKSAAGNNATLTYASPNTSGVLIAATPIISSITTPTNGNYDRTTNSTVSFTTVFDSSVIVTGTPRLTLNVGGTTLYANYTSGSGTKNIVFTYTVSGTDLDMDGITVSSPVSLNGGTIKSPGGADANLTFTSPDLSKVNVVYPDMVVWYDMMDSSTLFTGSDCTGAISANAAVGCIKDKSGKNHPALQSTLSYKPIYKTSGVKGLPSILFDGSDDVISATNHTDFDSMTGLTAIAVFMPTLVDGNPRGIISKRVSTASVTFSMFLYTGKYMTIDISNTSNRKSNSTVFVANQNYIATALFDGSLASTQRTKLYLDGALNSTMDSNMGTATTSTGNFHIGSLNDAYGQGLQGYIAEIIFVRRNLNNNSNNELAKIHAYLQTKWGL